MPNEEAHFADHKVSYDPNNDYYELFDIQPYCNPHQMLKKKYFKLCLQMHPDKQPQSQKEQATTKFQQMTQAYDILRDDGKRREYDRLRRMKRVALRPQAPTTNDYYAQQQAAAEARARERARQQQEWAKQQEEWVRQQELRRAQAAREHQERMARQRAEMEARRAEMRRAQEAQRERIRKQQQEFARAQQEEIERQRKARLAKEAEARTREAERQAKLQQLRRERARLAQAEKDARQKRQQQQFDILLLLSPFKLDGVFIVTKDGPVERTTMQQLQDRRSIIKENRKAQARDAFQKAEAYRRQLFASLMSHRQNVKNMLVGTGWGATASTSSVDFLLRSMNTSVSHQSVKGDIDQFLVSKGWERPTHVKAHRANAQEPSQEVCLDDYLESVVDGHDVNKGPRDAGSGNKQQQGDTDGDTDQMDTTKTSQVYSKKRKAADDHPLSQHTKWRDETTFAPSPPPQKKRSGSAQPLKVPGPLNTKGRVPAMEKENYPTVVTIKSQEKRFADLSSHQPLKPSKARKLHTVSRIKVGKKLLGERQTFRASAANSTNDAPNNGRKVFGEQPNISGTVPMAPFCAPVNSVTPGAASLMSKSNGTRVFCVTLSGQPCKNGLRKGDYCRTHEQQRPKTQLSEQESPKRKQQPSGLSPASPIIIE